MMVLLPIGIGVTFAGLTALKERTYTSAAAFRPQAANASQSQIAALAAHFGVGSASSAPMESPKFYTRLLVSRSILAKLLDSPFSFEHDSRRIGGKLPNLLEIEAATAACRREKAIDRLRAMISSRLAYDPGVVTVTVLSRGTALSALMAQRLLDLTAYFNVATRQSSAVAERKFIEGRHREAVEQLRAAEDRLQSFLQNNRQYQNSPPHLFEAERRQREIALRQHVYPSLSQALEQARIDEVRDTPVLTVLEPTQPAAHPDGRGTVMRGALGFGFGGVLALVLALLRDYLRRSREADRPDYRGFVRLRRTALGRLRGGSAAQI